MNKTLIAMSAVPLVLSTWASTHAAETPAAAAAIEATTGPADTSTATPPQPAHQATSADSRGTMLKEMVVSASADKPVQQRTELGVLTRETPLAGTVVGRKELESLHAVDTLHEIMRRVPGVSMVRNMRFPDGGKNYTDNRIDGMRARNTGTFGFIDQSNIADIERIECIRGPGSVLNSSSAIGGTMNVITRDPPAVRENEATAEVMEYGGFRAGLSSGAALTGTLGYFLNVNRLDQHGWRVHSAERKDSFSTKWALNPDDVSRLAFRLEYVHDDYQDPGSLTEAEFNADWRQASPGTFFRTNVSYLTPSLHYRRMFGESGELNVYGQSRRTDSSATASFNGTINDVGMTEDNVQLMYKHSFDLAKGALTGGVEKMATNSQTWGYANNSVSFDFVRGALMSNSIMRERHQSPFLQYEFSPLEPLRISAGARHDGIEYQIDDQINNRKDGSKTYNRLVRKLGATYELDRNNLVWASIAEGFLAPAVSTMLGSNTSAPATHALAVKTRHVPTNMNLLPEDSLTREIGIRGQLDSGLSYDIDYYQTRFNNLIVSQLCGATELCYTRNENAAGAHARGYETVLGYPVSDYLELGLSHTYSEYRYDNYVSAFANYTGTAHYYNPRNHFNLRVTGKPAPGWNAELELDHVDAYFTNQSNTDMYQRPDIYNLRIGYGDRRWSVWGHVLNLFDTKYAERVGATDAGVRTTFAAGYSARVVRLGLSYKF